MGSENTEKLNFSRHPEVADRLAEVESKRVVSFSSTNDDALLDRWIKGLNLVENSAYSLSGVGDGRHLRKFLEVLPRGCFVLCSEPDSGVMKAFSEAEESRELLEDPRLFLLAGEINEESMKVMERFPVIDVQDVQAVVFAPIYLKNEAYYSRFFLEFARSLDFWRKLHGTNVLYSGKWQGNTLKNLKQLITAPDVGALRGTFSGVPMILVSAGPSLDESLEFIKEHREHALIVAVNSSYRALRNAGIIPHFVLAADPYRSTDRGFAEIDVSETLLVCPFMVYPKVPARFAGRVFAWASNNLLVSHFRSMLNQPEGAPIIEQGTVSASALSFACLIGCNELILVGQDLAARDDGRTHATDSFYTVDGINDTNLKTCRSLPGNTLESVPVEEKLYVYLKTFESLCKQLPKGFRIQNTSRLGARIEGVPYVPLEEVSAGLEQYRGVQVRDKWESAKAFCSVEDSAASRVVAEVLEHLESYVQKSCELALSGALKLEKLQETATAQSREILKETLRLKEALSDHLESEEGFYEILKDGELKFTIFESNRDIRKLDPDLEVVEREVEELKLHFWAIAEGAYRFLSDLRANQGT